MAGESSSSIIRDEDPELVEEDDLDFRPSKIDEEEEIKNTQNKKYT